MRVLHVVEAIEAGVARHVTDVVRHVPADHEVAVTPERIGGFTDLSAFEAMEAAGARIHLTPMRRSVTDPRNGLAVARIRSLLRQSQPDVVHGHASIGGAAARLAAAGTSVARVYTPNGLHPSRAALTAERFFGRLTDRFIAVSETEAELAVRRRIIRRDRVAVIPNGIEREHPGPPTTNLRAELDIADGVPLVGCVARLATQKAPEIFVRACARVAAQVPEARFVLVGDGPLRDIVMAEAAAVGLNGNFAHLPGLPSAATVMDQLDVFVLPSRYEGGPYAPLEAMRAGTPVVLTDVVGNRDTAHDGDSGLVVPPDDPDALADGVLRLLTEPDLRQRLTERGKARAADEFDVSLMADRLEGVYESAVVARRSRPRSFRLYRKPKTAVAALGPDIPDPAGTEAVSKRERRRHLGGRRQPRPATQAAGGPTRDFESAITVMADLTAVVAAVPLGLATSPVLAIAYALACFVALTSARSSHLAPSALEDVPLVATRVVLAAMALIPLALGLGITEAHPWQIVGTLGGVVALRSLGYAVVRAGRKRGWMRRYVHVVGTEHDAVQVTRLFDENPDLGVEVTGVNPTIRVEGDQRGLTYVSVPSAAAPEERVVRMLRRAVQAGACVYLLPQYAALIPRSRHVEVVRGLPFIRLRAHPLHRRAWYHAKRASDVAVAAAGIVVLSPLLLAVAIAIRLSSRGPVLFRQPRIGRDGELFVMYKFRTFPIDHVDDKFSRELDECPLAVGRFLRRTSIDELPQLFNVLRGEMSLIGPRPERPHFAGRVADVVTDYNDRHRVRGGITGNAQVHGLWGNSSVEERIRLDNRYIDDWSPWRDLLIFARTFGASLRKGRDARCRPALEKTVALETTMTLETTDSLEIRPLASTGLDAPTVPATTTDDERAAEPALAVNEAGAPS